MSINDQSFLPPLYPSMQMVTMPPTTPGPGHYSPNFPFLRSTPTYKSIFLSNSEREGQVNKQQLQTPGVYRYNIQLSDYMRQQKPEHLNFQPAFCQQVEKSFKEKIAWDRRPRKMEITPGPGEYFGRETEFAKWNTKKQNFQRISYETMTLANPKRKSFHFNFDKKWV